MSRKGRKSSKFDMGRKLAESVSRGRPLLPQIRQAPALDAQAQELYMEQFVELICATLRWENLPAEIDKRFFTLALITHGNAVMYYSHDFERFIVGVGTPKGRINHYGNPTQWIVYGADGRTRATLDAGQCVPFYINYSRSPLWHWLEPYARRLADLDRTIEINCKLSKQPALLRVPESKRLSVDALVKAWTGDQPIIVGDDLTLADVSIEYINSQHEFVADKLQDVKMRVWSEIMTMLGIDNNTVDKAERVQSAEVRANNGQIESFRLVRLNMLREACAAANRKWSARGLTELWVDWNADISTDVYNSLMLTPVTSSVPDDQTGGVIADADGSQLPGSDQT